MAADRSARLIVIGLWDGPHACGCGAPGEPCPICNRVDDDTLPESPEGFIVDVKAKGWHQPAAGLEPRFFYPIQLPDGRRLATLRDAAEYITNLPASENDLPHWRAAVAALILSAEHGESGADPMLARIEMLRALHVGKLEATPAPRKKAAKKYKLVR